MWAREDLVSRPPEASGALVKVPLKGVTLSRAAQRASPRASLNSPAGLSFHIIPIAQLGRIVRALMRLRPVTINIKTGIIAWDKEECAADAMTLMRY